MSGNSGRLLLPAPGEELMAFEHWPTKSGWSRDTIGYYGLIWRRSSRYVWHVQCQRCGHGWNIRSPRRHGHYIMPSRCGACNSRRWFKPPYSAEVLRSLPAELAGNKTCYDQEAP